MNEEQLMDAYLRYCTTARRQGRTPLKYDHWLAWKDTFSFAAAELGYAVDAMRDAVIAAVPGWMKRLAGLLLDRLLMRNEAACQDCGLLYNAPEWIEAVVPNDIWHRIAPEDGLLCITCMARRCATHGLQDVPVMLAAGVFALEPYTPFNPDIHESEWS